MCAARDGGVDATVSAEEGHLIIIIIYPVFSGQKFSSQTFRVPVVVAVPARHVCVYVHYVYYILYPAQSSFVPIVFPAPLQNI